MKDRVQYILSYPIILQNLLCHMSPLSCRSLHKALRLNGTMLAREMNRPLAHSLITSEECILSHEPARIAPAQERITRGIAQCRNPGVVSTDAGEDLLQSLKTVLRILLYHLRVPGRR